MPQVQIKRWSRFNLISEKYGVLSLVGMLPALG